MGTRIHLRTWLRMLVVLLSLTCVATLSAQTVKEGSAKKGSAKKEMNGSAAKTAAPEIGDAAPDFTISTFDDKSITLSDHFGDDGHPVILLFSRANW